MSIFETRLLADAPSLLDSFYDTQLPLDLSHDTHLILVTIPLDSCHATQDPDVYSGRRLQALIRMHTLQALIRMHTYTQTLHIQERWK
jgi:hypothetical protein